MYHPRLLERLGVAPPRDWDDLLDPKLKGQMLRAQRRYQEVNAAFRREIESVAGELKRRY